MGCSSISRPWVYTVLLCFLLSYTVECNYISYTGDKSLLNIDHTRYKDGYQVKDKLRSLIKGDGIYVQAAESVNFNAKRGSLKTSGFSVSGRCLNDSLLILDSVKKQKEWAIRMLDAMGKIPSGALSGELDWYGDFDECIRIKEVPKAYMDVKAPYNAKYCLANIQIPGLVRPEFRPILPPGINTAVCVPGTCTETEIKQMMNFFINQQMKTQDLPENVTIEVDDVWCKDPSPPLTKLAIAAIVFCCLYGSILVLATTYDVVKSTMASMRKPAYIDIDQTDNHKDQDHMNGDVSEKLPLIGNGRSERHQKPLGKLEEKILWFSLYSNAKKILDISNTAKGPFSSFHGARFLSMGWIILGHTYLYGTVSFSNSFAFIPEVLDRVASQVIYNGTVSVDTFFIMSACLVATVFIKEWKRANGKMNWLAFYVHRFWRLSPTYFVVLFLMLGLSRYFYNGPLWPAHGMEYDSCTKTWWYNLLYITNFAPSQDEMCMDWTWYLANDMQFYLVAPLFILPFMYSERLGVALIAIVTISSSVITGIISYIYELQPHTIATDDKTQTTFIVYYVKPYCRIGPYLLGILVAYYVQKTDGRVKINKILNLFIWAIATVAACFVVYGLYDKARVFQPLPLVQAAIYLGISRNIWSLSVCWVFFACATGNAGFINTLLSWKPFIFLGRLTFCVYLTHPLVIRTYYFSLRENIYYTDIAAIFLYLGHMVMTHMVGFLVSISLEAPMLNIEKLLFRRK